MHTGFFVREEYKYPNVWVASERRKENEKREERRKKKPGTRNDVAVNRKIKPNPKFLYCEYPNPNQIFFLQFWIVLWIRSLTINSINIRLIVFFQQTIWAYRKYFDTLVL